MDKQILERWKDLKIKQGDFKFNCGGDSMGDTELTFEDEAGNVFEDTELANYFEDEVYRNVTFYEASDGHYMGESGNVYITLNDEEDDFEYSKSAQSEYCETESGVVLVPLTDKEFEVLNEYVGGMANSDWNGESVDYKKDFILTDDIQETISELQTKFTDYADTFQPETKGEVREDSYSYSTANDDETDMEFEDVEGVKHLKLNVRCEVYIYQDSD
jgi:hypothetical protein